jgi:H+-translocating diphosphatase
VYLYWQQVVFLVSYYALPHEFSGIFTADPTRISKNWHLAVAVIAGLWGGLVIGVCTEYYTSNRYQPTKVQPLAACTRLSCPKQHI